MGPLQTKILTLMGALKHFDGVGDRDRSQLQCFFLQKQKKKHQENVEEENNDDDKTGASRKDSRKGKLRMAAGRPWSRQILVGGRQLKITLAG